MGLEINNYKFCSILTKYDLIFSFFFLQPPYLALLTGGWWLVGFFFRTKKKPGTTLTICEAVFLFLNFFPYLVSLDKSTSNLSSLLCNWDWSITDILSSKKDSVTKRPLNTLVRSLLRPTSHLGGRDPRNTRVFGWSPRILLASFTRC